MSQKIKVRIVMTQNYPNLCEMKIKKKLKFDINHKKNYFPVKQINFYGRIPKTCIFCRLILHFPQTTSAIQQAIFFN
jgi:hypothetical protein